MVLSACTDYMVGFFEHVTHSLYSQLWRLPTLQSGPGMLQKVSRAVSRACTKCTGVPSDLPLSSCCEH